MNKTSFTQPEQKKVTLDLKNETAFKEFYKNKLGETYKKATPEQQKNFDEIISQIYKEQKRLADLKVEMQVKDQKSVIYDNGNREIEVTDFEDKNEILSFEERIDMLRREMEMVSRERDQIERRLAKMQVNPDGKTEGQRREEVLSSTFTNLQKGELGTLTPEQKEGIKAIIGEKSFEKITAGDFYALKREGYDLSQLLLVREFGGEKVNRDNIKRGDKFIVNFGKNQAAHNIVGAGDIFPMDKVYKIKVNGIEGTRGYSPRPGFYNGKQYLPIYDGDKVEVTEEKPFDPSEKETYEKAAFDRFKEIRGSEITSWLYNELRGKDENASNFALPYLSSADKEMLSHYIRDVLPKDVQANLSYDAEKRTISTKDWKPLKEVLNTIPAYEWKGTHHLRYMEHINKVEAEYGLPSGIMVRLIYHENGTWDPTLKAPGSTAYGLSQLPIDTWNDVCRWSKLNLDRNNPIDQITAGAYYLSHIAKTNHTHDGALLLGYYNTGPGIMRLGVDTIATYSRLNPAIRRIHPTHSPANAREYFACAVAYYSDVSYTQALERINWPRVA